MKKIINVILLCSILLCQYGVVYGQQSNTVEQAYSTNGHNIHLNGYFAEKNDILYYFKEDFDTRLLQLYQYHLQTEKETVLCSDYFKTDVAPVYNIRVCEDGYVYFYSYGYSTDMEHKIGVYRVSVNGGKSEYYGEIEKMVFLSDSWTYDTIENTFYNLATKQKIENTVTECIDFDYGITFLPPIYEYQNTVYICVNNREYDEQYKKTIQYKNGQILENGVYALPLYEQDNFYQLELKDNITYFEIYNDNLYYQKDNAIKQYHLQYRTTNIIAEIPQGHIDMLGIYHNILYYYHTVEKNGKQYCNIYGVYLYEKQNDKPFIVLPYAIGSNIHILEDVICYAKMEGAYIVNWKVYNYQKGKKYTISPY